MRSEGLNSGEEQMRSLRVRTRTEVRGSKSSLKERGDAVALMLESMSCFPSLPLQPLLSSYLSGKSVRVARYRRALRAIKKLVAKSGRNPDELALHVLPVGGATTLAAGGGMSGRVSRR